MTLTLDKPKDQKLVHSEISWQQFKLIQQGFSDQEFLDGTSPGFIRGINRKHLESKILKPPNLSVGSPPKSKI